MPWPPDPPPQRPTLPITEHAASGPVVLRNQRGTIFGRREEQRPIGKIVARDARGVLVGVYDARSNLTRNAAGRVLGSGHLLPALVPPPGEAVLEVVLILLREGLVLAEGRAG